MAKLIYTAMTSLDGYVNDEHGNFDWAAPDEEVHAFVNDLERPAGTYLYGRGMYDVMRPWETLHEAPDVPAVVLDYARLWQGADKVVFSRTLEQVTTARTRLEREFDPDAIRRMKAESDRDISIGGPGLAAEALRAGLVDELRVVLTPWVIGGGTSWLPGGVRLQLELVDEHRFAAGAVYLRFEVRSSA
jgi:dihydrofolate reductase